MIMYEMNLSPAHLRIVFIRLPLQKWSNRLQKCVAILWYLIWVFSFPMSNDILTPIVPNRYLLWLNPLFANNLRYSIKHSPINRPARKQTGNNKDLKKTDTGIIIKRPSIKLSTKFGKL